MLIRNTQKVSPFWVRTVRKPVLAPNFMVPNKWYMYHTVCSQNWFSHICIKFSHICIKWVQYLIERSTFSSGGQTFRIPVISFPFFFWLHSETSKMVNCKRQSVTFWLLVFYDILHTLYMYHFTHAYLYYLNKVRYNCNSLSTSVDY